MLHPSNPRRLLSTTILVAALVAVAPLAAAVPPTVFQFAPTLAPAPVLGLPPGAPSMVLPPVTITGVSGDWKLDGTFRGAGDTTPGVGVAALSVPTFNPMLGAPVAAVECEIVGANPLWAAWGTLPSVILAQDVDANNVVDPAGGPDVVAGHISFAYGAPPGPITGGPLGGEVFATIGGPLVPGVPLLLIAEDPVLPLGPWSPTFSLTVSCWAI